MDLGFIDTPGALHGMNMTSVSSNSSGKGGMLILALVPVELSLSLVGDTLTLPLAIYLKRAGYSKDNETAAAGNNQDAANGANPAAPADAPVPPGTVQELVSNWVAEEEHRPPARTSGVDNERTVKFLMGFELARPLSDSPEGSP